ncbi:IMS domain-containing protein [Actinomyces slackii]
MRTKARRGMVTLCSLVAASSLIACSGQEPSSQTSIPSLASPGTAASTSAGTAPPPSAAPTVSVPPVEEITTESLSDWDNGYQVVSIPENMDAKQAEAFMYFMAFDKTVWLAFMNMENSEETQATMTGEELQLYQDVFAEFENQGWRASGFYSVSVASVSLTADDSAEVLVCTDYTKMKVVNEQGDEVDARSYQHAYTRTYQMVKKNGTWLASKSEELGTDECA